MTRKKKSSADTHYEREAQKYDNPIASREYIAEYLETHGKPVTLPHLQKALGIKSDNDKWAFQKRLRAMLRDGQLMTDRRGRYCLIDKLDLLSGRVIGHPEGYGFVVLDQGGDDLFVSADQMRQVFDGDRVLVRSNGFDRRGREEAVIIEITDRKISKVVGRYCEKSGYTYVEPDNRRIPQTVSVSIQNSLGAKHGQIVVAEIVEYPTRRTPALGKIIAILGERMDPGMEIDIAIRSHNLPHEWPEEVLKEVQALPDKVRETDIEGRTDLRDLNLVTIDGVDAQDFDDAVYCEPGPKGAFRLIVAIADVGYYVKPGTAIDEAARERGNSVYFPGLVVPMLPEKLSNELCSLQPKVDRLCMVCDMHISAKGELTRYRFYEAVMHSKARLTYTEVAAILVDQDKKLRQSYAEVLPHLENLYILYKLLYTSRQKRGAIDFNFAETRIVFDENKKIEKIVPVIRNDAHRLIEECMLMANIAAAKFIEKEKIPGLFRVHSEPPPAKIEIARKFLSELGLQLPGGQEPRPIDYAKLLEAIAGRSDASVIQKVLLLSLSQAEYSAENIGHFGLAFASYAHFTSPIRRYPDLLVHRAINHVVHHQALNEFTYGREQMEQLGSYFSYTERRADEATRDVVAWLKCEFMQQFLGQTFTGVISGVTHFGLFVELNDIYVEGLVHITALKNDYYNHDPSKHRLVGERTRQIYRLGDPLAVTLVQVNLDERKITFELAGINENGTGKVE